MWLEFVLVPPKISQKKRPLLGGRVEYMTPVSSIDWRTFIIHDKDDKNVKDGGRLADYTSQMIRGFFFFFSWSSSLYMNETPYV